MVITADGMDNQELINCIQKLDDRLDRIEKGLFGDDAFDNPGIVRRLNKVEERVGGIEMKLTKILIFCAGAGATAAGFTELIMTIF